MEKKLADFKYLIQLLTVEVGFTTRPNDYVGMKDREIPREGSEKCFLSWGKCIIA